MHPVPALFQRNAWATERLLDLCQELPDAGAGAEPDVYGGIDALFKHIVSAETGYLRLVTGEVPEDRVREGDPRPLRELRHSVRWLADRWTAVLDSERDSEHVLLQQRGDDAEVMADWVPLVQAFHHGDDHRTQLNAVLTRRGIEPPSLDGWDFGQQERTAGPEPRGWWRQLLGRALGHHLWATERLLQRCRELASGQLELTAPATYGTLGKTLDHLVSADRSYLSRLRGGPRTPDIGTGDPAALLEHLARQREGWEGYLAGEPNFELLVKTRTGQAPAWVFVVQAIHHGNDHRTHAGTVLLRNQLEAPQIDVWAYAWEEGALRPLS